MTSTDYERVPIELPLSVTGQCVCVCSARPTKHAAPSAIEWRARRKPWRRRVFFLFLSLFFIQLVVKRAVKAPCSPSTSPGGGNERPPPQCAIASAVVSLRAALAVNTRQPRCRRPAAPNYACVLVLQTPQQGGCRRSILQGVAAKSLCTLAPSLRHCQIFASLILRA